MLMPLRNDIIILLKKGKKIDVYVSDFIPRSDDWLLFETNYIILNHGFAHQRIFSLNLIIYFPTPHKWQISSASCFHYPPSYNRKTIDVDMVVVYLPTSTQTIRYTLSGWLSHMNRHIGKQMLKGCMNAQITCGDKSLSTCPLVMLFNIYLLLQRCKITTLLVYVLIIANHRVNTKNSLFYEYLKEKNVSNVLFIDFKWTCLISKETFLSANNIFIIINQLHLL